MKKSKFILSALLCASFGLTACDFDISSILAQVGIGEKKVVEDNENEGKENESGDEGQGSEGQGGQSGGQTGGEGGTTGGETTFTLQYLKDIVKPMAASVLQMGADQLEFIEFDEWDIDENYENVLYAHEQEDLIFAGFFNSPDLEDTDTVEKFVELLEAQLPANAEKDTELSANTSPEEGFYLDFYKSGDLYYVIYGADNWFYIDYSLDVVPVSQVDTYLEYAYSSGDETDESDDEIDLSDVFIENR